MAADLRAATAEALEALTGPGGELAAKAPLASWRRYATGPDPDEAIYDMDRLVVHEHLIRRYLARQDGVLREGFAAVVTAGPPGAGKTRWLDDQGYGPEWRRIDADVFKEMLLADARSNDPALAPLLRRLLPDGRPIMLMELAGLFHHESTRLAEVTRGICLEAGENVVIEGTLGWSGMPQRLVKDLTDEGYIDLDVVVVETPLAEAQARALNRWWEGREGGWIGARFTPASAIADLYHPDGTSKCTDNAHMLVEQAEGTTLRVRLKD